MCQHCRYIGLFSKKLTGNFAGGCVVAGKRTSRCQQQQLAAQEDKPVDDRGSQQDKKRDLGDGHGTAGLVYDGKGVIRKEKAHFQRFVVDERLDGVDREHLAGNLDCQRIVDDIAVESAVPCRLHGHIDGEGHSQGIFQNGVFPAAVNDVEKKLLEEFIFLLALNFGSCTGQFIRAGKGVVAGETGSIGENSVSHTVFGRNFIVCAGGGDAAGGSVQGERKRGRRRGEMHLCGRGNITASVFVYADFRGHGAYFVVYRADGAGQKQNAEQSQYDSSDITHLSTSFG